MTRNRGQWPASPGSSDHGLWELWSSPIAALGPNQVGFERILQHNRTGGPLTHQFLDRAIVADQVSRASHTIVDDRVGVDAQL